MCPSGARLPIVHSPSGGLDSSVVAACLPDVPTIVTCLNVSTTGAGDESSYAREVAMKAGLQLVEHRRNGADVKLEDLLEAPAHPEPINWLARTYPAGSCRRRS